MAPVGGVIIAIGAGFRLLSIRSLLTRGALRPFPDAEERARLLVIAGAIETVAALIVTGIAFAGLKAGNAALDQAFGIGAVLWCALVCAELVLIALIGRDLARAFGYAILRWESAALLLLLIGGAAVAGAIAFFAGLAAGGDIPRMIATFQFVLFICTAVPALLLAAVLLFHLANAAERAREQLEDLLE